MGTMKYVFLSIFSYLYIINFYFTDWPVVPVFKNYSRGTPSLRIYIKNLSKTVTEYDLRYIFGRYVIPVSEDASQYVYLLA